MKKLLVFFVALFITTTAFSQNYNTAVGARAGFPISATFKMFLGEKSAVELLGGVGFNTGYNALHVRANYIMHNDIGSVTGLQWYWGLGGGAVFNRIDIGDNSTGVSFNGVAGVEYTFSNIPLVVGVDYQPSVVIGGGTAYSGFYGSYYAATARYCIGGNNL